MVRVLWKLPQSWNGAGLAQRAMLYPALYLPSLGLSTALSRAPSRRELGQADAMVLVVDGPLSDDERLLLRRRETGGAPLVVSLISPPDEEDQRLIEAASAVLAAPHDEGPLASAFAGLPDMSQVVVPGAGARPAEDRLVRDLLGMQAEVEARSAAKSGHALVVIDGPAAEAQLSPILARLQDQGLEPVLVAAGPDLLAAGGASGAGLQHLDAASERLLEVLADAHVLLCPLGSAPALSPLPGVWVRTALAQGVPVIAASHPSVDGLAHLCVLDDWERGLDLYGRAGERLRAGARGQAAVLAGVAPGRIAARWRAALEHAAGVAGGAGRRERKRSPLLLVLFDLGQDLEVLLPIVLAVRERRRVRLRLVVTDWLKTEAPRTLQALETHGLAYELVDRGAARQGIAPAVHGADAVLTGSDTSAGPHRAAHALARRAASAGLRTFTLQHGLENIGLTYRDGRYGPEVTFASDTVFCWGPAEALPDWVRPETRRRICPLGSPKPTPPPARRLRLDDGAWRKIIGVFENLHWDRFDETFRNRFLADLDAAAAAAPDALFAVKPHHAGRWLSRERSRLGERPNIRLLDPADPAWQPYTAPDIIPSVDLVITTPSTVALDAARAGRPVAIVGYDLDLESYDPLPMLRSSEDWRAFVLAGPEQALGLTERFLARVMLPGRADHRIAAAIETALLDHAREPPGAPASDPPPWGAADFTQAGQGDKITR